MSQIRDATRADRPAVLELLHAEGLSSQGIDPDLRGFLVATAGERLEAVAGLEQYGSWGLLRSVAVAADRRGRGLGRRLTEAIVEQARLRRLEALYALTTTAAEYFPRLGFERIDRAAVPGPVQASEEFREICPASAAVLRLGL